MAHGFSAVKEMYLDSFAEVFAAAGLHALVFDNRNFAPATVSPVRRSIPGRRSATTGTPSPYASTRPEVDAFEDRDLGQQLLRRPCPGRRGDRSSR